MSLRTVIVKMKADVTGVTEGMSKAQETVRGATDGMSKAFSRIDSALKSAAKELGNIGVRALKAGDQMGDSMGVIQAQTGQSDEAMTSLNRSVRDLALTQGRFSAQKMMDALAGAAIHGQTAEEQMLTLDAAMLAADATGTKLGKATYLLGSTLLKFGQDASYAEMWTGKFAAAQRFTNTSMGDMVKALGKAAPTMNMHNLAVQQGGTGYARLAATMAVAQQEMMTHTQSARGFEIIMNTLNSSILNGSEMFDKIGVATRNADGSARDHFDVLDDLVDVFGRLTPEMAYAVTEYMELGVYGAALFDVMSRQYPLIGDLANEMQDLGHAHEMAGSRTGGFAEVIGIAQHVLDEFFLIINDVIGSKFYKWAQEAAGQLKVFFETARENGTIERLAESVMSFVEIIVNLTKTLIPIVVEWLPKLIDIASRVAEVIGNNAEIILLLWGAFKGYTIVKNIIGVFESLKVATGLLKGKKALGGLSPAMGKAVGSKSGGGMLGGAKKLAKGIGPKGWAVLAIGAGVTATIRYINNQRQSMEEDYNAMYIHTGSTTAAMAYAAAQNMGRMSDEAQSKMSELMKSHGHYFDEMYAKTGNESEAMAAVVSKYFGNLKDTARSNLDETAANAEAAWAKAEAATDDATREMYKTTARHYEDLNRQAGRELRKLEQQYQYYGEALPNGMETGLRRGEPSALTAIGDFASNIASGFRNFFGINSPSTVMTGYGQGMGQGVENGLSSTQASIVRTVTGINNAITTQVRNLRNQTELYGNRAGTGLSAGLDRARNGIMNTARNIANAVTSTLSRALNISSPSRVLMELGEFTGVGFYKGIENSIKDIENASYGMAMAAIPDLRNQINDTSEGIRDVQSQSQAPIYITLDGHVVGELIADRVTLNQNRNSLRQRTFRGGMV